MGDLISRSALIEKLKDLRIDNISLNGKSIVDIIAEQPTAYSIENVVAELEEMKYCLKVPQKVCDIYSDCGLCYVGRAIDIVKRGGVDERT